MKIYRVIDYDFPGDFIVIRTFIDFDNESIGIKVTVDGEYIGEIDDSFDTNKVVVKKHEIDVYVGYPKNTLNYNDFANSLTNWWKEPDRAYQILIKTPDTFLLKSLERASQRIIKKII